MTTRPDPPAEDGPPPERPPVFERLRIERERTPDGRAVLYFSWPERDEPAPPAEGRDV